MENYANEVIKLKSKLQRQHRLLLEVLGTLDKNITHRRILSLKRKITDFLVKEE